jgi:hypothetical protein
MGKTFRKDNEFEFNKNHKFKKNKKLSKLNNTYLNKGRKIRDYQTEIDDEI